MSAPQSKKGPIRRRRGQLPHHEQVKKEQEERWTRRDARAQPSAGEPSKASPPRPRQEALDLGGLEQLAGLDSGDFAAELEAAMGPGMSRKRHTPGERVEGRVAGYTQHDCILSLGAKSDGWLERKEFASQGLEEPAPGQLVTAYVVQYRAGELRLGLRPSGSAAREELLRLAEQSAEVEGRVLSRRGGGFLVELEQGVKAFCPLSKIDRHPGDGEELDRFLGQTYRFRLLQGEEEGDFILSRRVLQQEAARAEARAFWETAREGELREGVLLNTQPFGAFVDLGGLEGLIPQRELEGVTLPPKFSTVPVRIVSLDREQGRITLGFEGEDSPWVAAGGSVRVGTLVYGVLKRKDERGGRVELEGGLTGRLSAGTLRRFTPEEQEVGARLQVAVKQLDPLQRRLILGHPDELETQPSRPGQEQFGTLGDLFSQLKRS